jgi:hypothetical protein
MNQYGEYKHKYNCRMSVQEILDKIIKPSYRAKYNDWENYAKSIDKFGLECIDTIYRSKGTRKIEVTEPIAENKTFTTMKNTFMNEAKVPLYLCPHSANPSPPPTNTSMAATRSPSPPPAPTSSSSRPSQRYHFR